MCYTYDNLNRVTARTIKNATTNAVISAETFNYDAAGNITDAPNSCFEYDVNNRLVVFNGNTVEYDMDGNMLSNGDIHCAFDSGNRLVKAGDHSYTYNAEDVRIRNLCADADTTYTYNTNCKLSQLLCKTTNGITTKYVYGLGLIGEEKRGEFKTYHFDFRGSTVAITDQNGNITDTFQYDTYGKLISRTGGSFVIFGYNGRDGVVTDRNGLLYMRARYYSPDMRRFVNADIIPGEISNAITLNRFAYANGNPVSFVDPFGLSPDIRVSNAQEHEGDKNIDNMLAFFGVDSVEELPTLPENCMVFVENITTITIMGVAYVHGVTIVMDNDKYCMYSFNGVSMGVSGIPYDYSVTKGYVYNMESVDDFNGVFFGGSINYLTDIVGGAVAPNGVTSEIIDGVGYMAPSISGSVTFYDTPYTDWQYEKAEINFQQHPYNYLPSLGNLNPAV